VLRTDYPVTQCHTYPRRMESWTT